METTERTVESTVSYKGLIVNVRTDKAELPTGKIVRREVVEHPGGVAVLPLDADGNVIAVRQFRYPFMEETLEIPAGKLEYGESHFDCGLRELREETGFEPDAFFYLGKIYPSPGYSAEVLHLYLATGLKQVGASLDPDEFLNVEVIPFREMKERAAEGKILDAKTLTALFLAEMYLEERDD